MTMTEGMMDPSASALLPSKTTRIYEKNSAGQVEINAAFCLGCKMAAERLYR